MLPFFLVCRQAFSLLVNLASSHSDASSLFFYFVLDIPIWKMVGNDRCSCRSVMEMVDILKVSIFAFQKHCGHRYLHTYIHQLTLILITDYIASCYIRWSAIITCLKYFMWCVAMTYSSEIVKWKMSIPLLGAIIAMETVKKFNELLWHSCGIIQYAVCVKQD